jgi:hypothetical protein
MSFEISALRPFTVIGATRSDDQCGWDVLLCIDMSVDPAPVDELADPAEAIHSASRCKHRGAQPEGRTPDGVPLHYCGQCDQTVILL